MTLVLFCADWCRECREVMKEVDKFKSLIDSELQVLKVDIDAEVNKVKADEYGVDSVPMLMFFRSGEVLWRHKGVILAAELRTIFDGF